MGESPHTVYYGIADGLPSVECYETLQNTDGAIWVITDRGVARFNGKEFKSYGVNDGLANLVNLDIHPGVNGMFWLAGLNGNITYWKEGKFYPFEFNKEIREIIGRGHWLKIINVEEDLLDFIIAKRALNKYRINLNNGRIQKINFEKIEVYNKGRDSIKFLDDDFMKIDAPLNSDYRPAFPFKGKRISFYGQYLFIADIASNSITKKNVQKRINSLQIINQQIWVMTDDGIQIFHIEEGKVKLANTILENSKTASANSFGDHKIFICSLSDGLIEISNKDFTHVDDGKYEDIQFISLQLINNSLVAQAADNRLFSFDINKNVKEVPVINSELIFKNYVDNFVRTQTWKFDGDFREIPIFHSAVFIKEGNRSFHLSRNKIVEVFNKDSTKLFLNTRTLFVYKFKSDELMLLTTDGIYRMYNFKGEVKLEEIGADYNWGNAFPNDLEKVDDDLYFVSTPSDELLYVKSKSIYKLNHPELESRIINNLMLE
ncbi:MAG: hypothetical protein AAGK97_02305, partial [Bacteroidota bacterium]